MSAQHQREALILQARAYEISAVQAARARALVYQNGAEAQRAQRTGTAQGEAEAFSALESSHARDRDLFRFRKRLEMLESNLDGRSFNIVDDRIERDGGHLWIF